MGEDPSEHELQGELDLPPRKRTANRSERRGGDVGRWRPEVRVVQDVEELRPELQRHAFARRDPETLVYPEVPLPEVQTAQSIAAEASKRRAGGRHRECSAVPVLVDHGSSAEAFGIPDQVRALLSHAAPFS